MRRGCHIGLLRHNSLEMHLFSKNILKDLEHAIIVLSYDGLFTEMISFQRD